MLAKNDIMTRGAAVKSVRRIIRGAAVIVVFACAAVIVARLYVTGQTADRRYSIVSNVPPRPVALVFGAGLLADRSPTPMLADRVDAAVELFHAGKVRRLLFSGDNSRPDYNEVGSMLKYAVARGVPRSDVTLDYAGFDTYDSCYRARAIFGVTSAVLVTQRYHLPRAVYDCTTLGIDSVGIGTPDWGEYGAGLLAGYELRESIADVKSLWDVHVSHRAPTLLGAHLGLR